MVSIGSIHTGVQSCDLRNGAGGVCLTRWHGTSLGGICQTFCPSCAGLWGFLRKYLQPMATTDALSDERVGPVQSRQSIIYMGCDTRAADVVYDCLGQVDSACQLISTEEPPADEQLWDCRLLIADLDSGFPDSLELFLECMGRCSFLRALTIVRHGDVAIAVQAMKHGAIDCVEKPVDELQMKAKMERIVCFTDDVTASIWEKLTRTERVVLAGILQGRTTKALALALHRSPRTIEVHRKHIMRKLRVSTIPDLVLLAADHRMAPACWPESARSINAERNGLQPINRRSPHS